MIPSEPDLLILVYLTKLRLSKMSDPYPDVLQIKLFPRDLFYSRKVFFELLGHESHTYAIHGEFFGYT